MWEERMKDDGKKSGKNPSSCTALAGLELIANIPLRKHIRKEN